MNKYSWKLKALAKGVDADAAIAELEKVESVMGRLTPENIVNYAQKEDSVLNKLFEWDDSIAAHHFRLQQARNILNNIEVAVVSDGEPRHISVYEVVSSDEGRVYKHISALTTSEIEEVRKATVRELSRIKSKLANYNEFDKVTQHLDSAIEEIAKPVEKKTKKVKYLSDKDLKEVSRVA